MSGGPRRSAGMRGDPRHPRPEAGVSSELPPRVETPKPEAPVSRSRYPKPQVLMGEVMAPRGAQIAAGHDAFRTFMQKKRLTPSKWAADAGVPLGEIMGFLTGRSRDLSPDTQAKLARAAGVTPDAMFGQLPDIAR